jgi:murein L,D-transpeptidase YcbB/YkuD
MKNPVCTVVILSFLLIQCGQQKPALTEVARDITITPANAFSELFLDSVQVEEFITSQELGDTAASRFRNFYNSRNYQFAWFTNDGLAEQAGVFWNLHNQYVDYAQDSTLVDQQLHDQMDMIYGDTALHANPKTVTQTELRLTQHFFEYVRHAYAGKMDPESLKWHIPRKKVDAVALLDSLIQKKGADPQSWEPLNKPYRAMKKELIRFYELSKKGGWDSLPLIKGHTYKMGSSGDFILRFKNRLVFSNDFTDNDTTGGYTESLREAVKRVQKQFGYKQNGVINYTLIKALNVPVNKRIEQLLINMERMRWMPEEAGGERIIANIPEFKIHVFDDTSRVFEMDVVVGKAGNNTVVFNEDLKYIVFSPFWNVPKSIVKREILPAMLLNSGYLASKNMEQTGTSDGVPIIRQKPGGANALGRVKFLFPNSYNIYFHDSPAKSLFAREKRDFSHGCIRLAEPVKMAKYLLRNMPEWTDKKIADAMDTTVEKWVTLPKPVPVVISYFTAWVDGEGLLNFREDIYNHDREMGARMFVTAKK